MKDRYSAAATAAAARYPFRGAQRLYWAAIRQDLIDNQEALDEVRQQLAGGDAFAKSLSRLSHLRLIDILIWSAEDGARALRASTN